MQSNEELLKEVAQLKNITVQLAIIHDSESLANMTQDVRDKLCYMVGMIWDRIEDGLLTVEQRKHEKHRYKR